MLIGNSTLAAVQARIIAGFGLGNPGAAAIASSTALTPGTTFLIPLDADTVLGNGSAGSAIGRTFDGAIITDPGTIIVKYAYFGDLTLDGIVDGLDYATAVGHFGQPSPGLSNITAAWMMGDLNFDNIVNAADFFKMSGNLGAQLFAAGPGEVATISPVALTLPEPSCLILLGLGSLALFKRKRRSSPGQK
jgi:hypothetical protein